MTLWEIPGKVKEFDEDWRVATCIYVNIHELGCLVLILWIAPV